MTATNSQPNTAFFRFSALHQPVRSARFIESTNPPAPALRLAPRGVRIGERGGVVLEGGECSRPFARGDLDGAFRRASGPEPACEQAVELVGAGKDQCRDEGCVGDLREADQ
jgi:hypothetical protein